MPKTIKLEPHLSSQELESRYRKAHDPVLRTHYQILWLISEAKTTAQVMEVTGYTMGSKLPVATSGLHTTPKPKGPPSMFSKPYALFAPQAKAVGMASSAAMEPARIINVARCIIFLPPNRIPVLVSDAPLHCGSIAAGSKEFGVKVRARG